MKYLKRLTLVHWAWMHAKVALGVWAVLLYTFTPERVNLALGWVLIGSVTLVTLVGAVVSIVGLVMSVQLGRVALAGLTIELSGLYFMLLGGAFPYLVTQFSLAFGSAGSDRIALTAFAYAMCAFLLCRIALVTSRRRKETL
jgi:hypothetical protein